jgi:ATP-dependent DNA ligase
MHARAAGKTGDAVTFVAFDLLVLDGSSAMDLPLLLRKALLKELLASAPLKRVLYLDELDPDTYWQAVLGARLEGVMAKRWDSRTYRECAAQHG